MSAVSAEPRWRRLPEERPQQIIDAAFAIFSERGLAAARLDDIAKRAGLSKGTIYLYFPSKEDLFREVVRKKIVTRIEEREQAFLGSADPASEVLDGFMRHYWTFMRSPEFGPMFRLVHAEIRNFPDLAAFYAEEVIARSHRLIEKLIERGRASGEFRDIEPRVAARMIASTFVMHGVWCTHREHFPAVATRSDEQVLAELMEFFHYALRPCVPQTTVQP